MELEPGVEGLVHISEMSWSKRLRHPSKILTIGDTVDVGVLEVDMAKRRISLSLKASLPDPWTTIGEKYAVGAVVQGRVRNLTDFGAFVEIEDGVDGLIHLSNMSWNRNIKHPSEILKKGQKVDAAVLALDPANRRLALGLKQLEEDPWESLLCQDPCWRHGSGQSFPASIFWSIRRAGRKGSRACATFRKWKTLMAAAGMLNLSREASTNSGWFA